MDTQSRHYCDNQPTSYVPCLRHCLALTCGFSQDDPGKTYSAVDAPALYEPSGHGLLDPMRWSLSWPKKNNHIWEGKKK